MLMVAFLRENCYNKITSIRVCHRKDVDKMHYSEDEHRYILDIPKQCPNCGNDLELDTSFEKTNLLCNHCDYILDVTDEFKNFDKHSDS